MAIIKHGKVHEDAWRHAGEPADLDHEGPLFVGLAEWHAERERLIGRNSPTGLRLDSHEAPEDAADVLPHVEAVALDFPKFTDGRAYSHARVLRERLGFSGEVRAVGEVLPDQVLLMARCGFDAFELPEGARVEAYLEAFEAFGVFYQPASDISPVAARLRRRREAQAS